jgi:DNA polymerase-3 subunit delta'
MRYGASFSTFIFSGVYGMLGWEPVLGQEHVQGVLQQALAKGRLSHAYLFSGPEGLGQEKVLHDLVRSLSCSVNILKPCGECPGCRSFAGGRHPDLHLVFPDGGSIKLDQIRSLQHVLSLHPYLGSYRVCIVHGAEAMTIQAANSFLKMLEEPGDRVVFILLCRSAESLPKTIVSRCQVLPFRPIPAGILQDRLLEEGVPPDRARAAASLAEGRPGEAERLLQDENWAERERIIEELSSFPQVGGIRVLALAEEWSKDREKADLMLDMALLWYRDLLVLATTERKDLVINCDHLPELVSQAQRYTSGELIQALEIIEGCRPKLAGNVNLRLLLEDVFFTLTKEVV